MKNIKLLLLFVMSLSSIVNAKDLVQFKSNDQAILEKISKPKQNNSISFVNIEVHADAKATQTKKLSNTNQEKDKRFYSPTTKNPTNYNPHDMNKWSTKTQIHTTQEGAKLNFKSFSLSLSGSSSNDPFRKPLPGPR